MRRVRVPSRTSDVMAREWCESEWSSRPPASTSQTLMTSPPAESAMPPPGKKSVASTGEP